MSVRPGLLMLRQKRQRNRIANANRTLERTHALIARLTEALTRQALRTVSIERRRADAEKRLAETRAWLDALHRETL